MSENITAFLYSLKLRKSNRREGQGEMTERYKSTGDKHYILATDLGNYIYQFR